MDILGPNFFSRHLQMPSPARASAEAAAGNHQPHAVRVRASRPAQREKGESSLMSQGITVTTELPPNPETPTVTYYQSLANDVMKALEQIGVAVPQVDPAQFVSAKITRGKLRVPDQFCITATISAE